MADPDLQIRGGGRGSDNPDSEIRGRGGGVVSKNKSFRPFGPNFGLKITVGDPGQALRWIRHCRVLGPVTLKVRDRFPVKPKVFMFT